MPVAVAHGQRFDGHITVNRDSKFPQFVIHQRCHRRPIGVLRRISGPDVFEQRRPNRRGIDHAAGESYAGLGAGLGRANQDGSYLFHFGHSRTSCLSTVKVLVTIHPDCSVNHMAPTPNPSPVKREGFLIQQFSLLLIHWMYFERQLGYILGLKVNRCLPAVS